MKITAVAVEDLKSKGLELLPAEMKLTVKGNVFPDVHGECIGRYDKSTEKFESFFKKDKENGNTYYFDQYRKKCNLIEKHRNVINRLDHKEKQVIDYYVPYDIKESSKNRPTEIEDHVDTGICLNGHYKCEYELLFACEGDTRRVVIPHTSVNIPMYDFIGDLEDEVEEGYITEEQLDVLLKKQGSAYAIFLSVLSECDDYFEVIMFDEVGMNSNVTIERASELISMLISIRLLSCEFIENKEM